MEVIINNEGGAVKAALNGRLDTAAAASVGNDFEALMQQADKQIVLDCEGLEYISSSGLRLLLALRKATMAKGGGMTLTNVNEQVNRVFAMTGFINLFQFA